MSYEEAYVSLVDMVLENGERRETRAGPTRSCFGCALAIDSLEHGRFPILTQRQISFKGVLGELAAFLRGATTLSMFKHFGCNYWDANAAAWAPNKEAS